MEIDLSDSLRMRLNFTIWLELISRIGADFNTGLTALVQHSSSYSIPITCSWQWSWGLGTGYGSLLGKFFINYPFYSESKSSVSSNPLIAVM